MLLFSLSASHYLFGLTLCLPFAKFRIYAYLLNLSLNLAFKTLIYSTFPLRSQAQIYIICIIWMPLLSPNEPSLSSEPIILIWPFITLITVLVALFLIVDYFVFLSQFLMHLILHVRS